MSPPKQAATALALSAAAVLLCCSIGTTNAQENAQLQIPPSLVECYNTSYFMNRDNRLPMNIETLITLIEKVENSYGFDQDIRTLSVSLLHRFRQDGIQRAPNVVNSPDVIPYSPTGFQFPKFRILLSRLIPGNALRFPNNTLSREERCSLHFMLSSSFETRVRGDENQVCNQLSQYRAQRLPRQAPKEQSSNFLGDVELLENWNKRENSRGAPKMRVGPNTNAYDIDVGWSQTDYGYGSASVPGNDVSQCPVENGVMRTPWGTVAAGTVIAGIAAGLQQQNVQLRTLLSLSRRPGGPSSPQMATVNIDNRWAATLAGDLAEVALVQVPVSPTETATVGANGAWNSTVMPKWYFLTQRQNMEMTDAEIRGGLDGLILAMNVMQWRTQASNLKLSQLLRMYYSMDGVLGSGIMACNRKDNFPNVAPLNTMIAQTSAFAQVLDREMRLRVTLAPGAIATFSTAAANALTAYIPQYMNDVSCSVSNALPQDISQSITAMTNINVFLDTSWQYYNVAPYVNYVLQSLNINPYASSVTLLAANDGTIIVNTTNYMSDVYEQWNVTTHATFVPGFNLPTVLRTVQNLTQNYMNGERTNNSVGGRSLVALLIPNMGMVNSGDSSYSTNQLQYLSEQIPDLRFIYYTGGTTNRFNSFVPNPSQDIYPLNIGTNVASSASPVIARIKKIPRRIINPRCGANWWASSTGTDQMAQYLYPGDINFYRVAPNYFFGAGGGRSVSISAQNSLQLTVCTSRSVVLPSQNATTTVSGSSNDQNCVAVSGNPYNYDLSNACGGYPTIHACPPLYLSVQAASSSGGNTQGGSSQGGSSQGGYNPGGYNPGGYTPGGNTPFQTVSCIDPACQTPAQTKYTVSVVNMGCWSGVSGLVANLATIAFACLLRHILK